MTVIVLSPEQIPPPLLMSSGRRTDSGAPAPDQSGTVSHSHASFPAGIIRRRRPNHRGGIAAEGGGVIRRRPPGAFDRGGGGSSSSGSAAAAAATTDDGSEVGTTLGGVGGEGRESLLERVLGDAIAALSLSVLALCAYGLLILLSVLYVTVRPLSRPSHRRLCSDVAVSSFLDAAALLLPNLHLVLTGESDVPGDVGASVLVCNHLVEGDWWAVLMLARCVGLRGTVRVFLRSEVLRGLGGVGSSYPSVPTHVSAAGSLLRTLLEFPVLSSESGGVWARERDELFDLLRGFAEGGAPAPVHLLLFPEGWSLENSGNGSGGGSSSGAGAAEGGDGAGRGGRQWRRRGPSSFGSQVHTGQECRLRQEGGPATAPSPPPAAHDWLQRQPGVPAGVPPYRIRYHYGPPWI